MIDYNKCEVWKEKEGFPCFVCTAIDCFRNKLLETLKYANGKCVAKGCENPRLKDTKLPQYCKKHQGEKNDTRITDKR